jgi:hypothetical protein
MDKAEYEIELQRLQALAEKVGNASTALCILMERKKNSENHEHAQTA